MGKEKRIFVAATRQNDGKTVVSIGLVLCLKKALPNIGFIKPVGQKYVLVNGEKVDKDSVLMKKICGLSEAVKDMNPIAVEEGFTSRYLDAPDPTPLHRSIKESYQRVAEGKDMVVIEGTGHAGVGSVFDLSNAEVAGMLNAPVLLISIGGIGRPLDEIALNAALFEKKGVVIKGVIINKVLEEKKAVVEKHVVKGLARMNMKLIGILPFVPLLSQPNIFQVCEVVKGRVLAGESKFARKIGGVLVGAMTARHALDRFKPNSLLVTPGDREDLILAALSHCTISHGVCDLVCGLVLTGGLQPHKTILDLIKKADVPTILSSAGTYEVASAINGLVGKIREEDTDKIEIARKLVEENIRIEEIFN